MRRQASEICALFDSVYVSLYKGIGGIAGAILAGEKAFTEESKVWKRRHGGDLIRLYPYIISSDYYFNQRIDKMEQYYQEAQELAAFYNGCHLVSTKPVVPVSNMFHVHIEGTTKKLEKVLVGVYEETGVGLTSCLRGGNETSCYFGVSIGDLYQKVPKVQLEKTFQLLDVLLKEI
jgi:threonine aldolase